MHSTDARPALVLIALVVLALGGCGLSGPAEEYALRIDYLVQPVDGTTPSPADLEASRAIVERRLDATGLAALRVSAVAPDRLVVEASPAEVAEDIRDLVGATGRVDFVPLGDEQATEGERLDLDQHPPLFSGDQVGRASVGEDQSGQPTVDLVLGEEATQAFGSWTADHVGESFAIVLDGVVVSAPVIREAIPGGQVQISLAGSDNAVDAQRLITLLRFGPLPHPVAEVPPPPE